MYKTLHTERQDSSYHKCVISLISYSGKIVCSTWRGSQKRRGSKARSRGSNRTAPHEPLTYRAIKNRVFFPGFWLWFTETVRPIKKIQTSDLMDNVSYYLFTSVSNTNISNPLFFFFTLSDWAFMMHLSLNGAIVCKPDCVSTEACTRRLRLYLPKSYTLPKNSIYM